MSISSEQFREMQSRTERAKFREHSWANETPVVKQSANEKRESEIQNEIEAYLESLGRACYYVRSRMDKATTNKVGTPDFVGWHKGKPFAIEVKAAARKVTQEQAGELLRCNLAGAVAWVAFNVDDVKKILGDKKA